ncbi:transmembrane amino acid transporter protein, partial [Ostertagia ostertagi]
MPRSASPSVRGRFPPMNVSQRATDQFYNSDLYLGLVFFIVLMSTTMYTAYALGNCWNILRNNWSIYKVHCRKPYPSIGYRAIGPKCRKFVSFIIDVNQFGVSTVFVLLSSKTIHDMVKTLTSTDISYCFVVLIVAVCLLPVTWLKSPQDFWLAVMVAMLTVFIAIILVFVGIALDYGLCSPYTDVPPITAKNLFLSLGTIMFACGGHAAFPTVQHDMRDPGEYTKSVVSAFIALFSLYGPVAIFGYLAYHGAVRDSILPSVQAEWIQHTCNALITIHCILTVTIIISPLNQDLEDLFHCPHYFGWQRALIRSATMLGIVIVCESIPNFGPILDLIGGSTMTLASVILPCVFYLYLLAREEKAKKFGKVDAPPSFTDVLKYAPRITIAICFGIIGDKRPPDVIHNSVLAHKSVLGCMYDHMSLSRTLLGLIGGAAATFSAIMELSTTSFQMPCYVNIFIHE